MSRVVPSLSAVAVLVASLSLPSTPAAAFLDFLFGRPQPQQGVAPRSALDISVQPRRASPRPPRTAHRKPAKAQVAARNEQKAVLQPGIDPVANPDWFLTDPTLRAGDIVILKSGPFVYQGGRRGTHLREDYASLGESRMISRTSARDVRMMASGIWVPPDPAAVGPARKKRRSRR